MARGFLQLFVELGELLLGSVGALFVAIEPLELALVFGQLLVGLAGLFALLLLLLQQALLVGGLNLSIYLLIVGTIIRYRN